MRKVYIFFVAMIWYSCIYAQSPVDYDIRLSGSFGEPRSGHFHAGLDIKSSHGSEGDPIFSIEEGYVSRVRVEASGCGLSLVVTHPQGINSVYCHLSGFEKEIASWVKNLQYNHQQFEVDTFLLPKSFKLGKHQKIGFLGNTGGSSGPHLHFELRKTNSDICYNPKIKKYGSKDDIKPTILGVYVYELTKEGTPIGKTYYPLSRLNANGAIQVKSKYFGIGLHGYDKMNGAYNHNGIYGVKMYMNNDLKFHTQLDSIYTSQSELINLFYDYEEKQKRGRHVIRCFKSPLNPFRNYYACDRECYNFGDQQSQNIELSAYDIDNNRTTINFKIQWNGEVSTNAKPEHNFVYVPNKINFFETESFIVEMPATLAYYPLYMKIKEKQDGKLQILAGNEPIFAPFKIHYKCIEDVKSSDELILILSSGRQNVYSEPSISQDRKICYFEGNDLGTYYIGVDKTPPSIGLIRLPNHPEDYCKFRITDNIRPVNRLKRIKYNVYLDDQWILFDHDYKSKSISHRFMREDLTMGKHTIRVELIDGQNNKTIKEYPFTVQSKKNKKNNTSKKKKKSKAKKKVKKKKKSKSK